MLPDYDVLPYPDINLPNSEWMTSISLNITMIVMATSTLAGLSLVAKRLKQRSYRYILTPKYDSRSDIC